MPGGPEEFLVVSLRETGGKINISGHMRLYSDFFCTEIKGLKTEITL